MEMENYICINGKKAELTEEQMKALGIELPNANPFARTNPWGTFYYIDTIGLVYETFDDGSCDGENCDSKRFAIANYCTDKAIMEQRALHETLNRLLWRYSMMHGGDKIDWCNVSQEKFEIDFTHYKDEEIFEVCSYTITQNICSVYFTSEETAFNAIEEIVKPFIAAHPNFKF